MKKESRLKVAPFALLVLLVMLTLLVVKRVDLTAEEAEVDTEREVGKLGNTLLKDGHAAVAFLVVMALFALVMWAALRANKGEDKAMPPAQESSANGTREAR
jgi:hypothetical protein